MSSKSAIERIGFKELKNLVHNIVTKLDLNSSIPSRLISTSTCVLGENFRFNTSLRQKMSWFKISGFCSFAYSNASLKTVWSL